MFFHNILVYIYLYIIFPLYNYPSVPDNLPTSPPTPPYSPSHSIHTPSTFFSAPQLSPFITYIQFFSILFYLLFNDFQHVIHIKRLFYF